MGLRTDITSEDGFTLGTLASLEKRPSPTDTRFVRFIVTASNPYEKVWFVKLTTLFEKCIKFPTKPYTGT